MIMSDLTSIAEYLADCTAFQEWVGDTTNVDDAIIYFNADLEELPERVCLLYPGPSTVRTAISVNSNCYTQTPTYVLHFEKFVNRDSSTRTELLAMGNEIDGIMSELEDVPKFIYQWQPEKEDPSRSDYSAQLSSVRYAILIELFTK
jgi:hypothetical protein